MVGVPDIFDSGISCLIRRALIIGNGAAGAEHQSLGLVRALGLGDSYTLERINRPREGFNYWLRWLPVNLHRGLNKLLHADLPFLGLRYLPFSSAEGAGIGRGSDAWGVRDPSSLPSSSRNMVEGVTEADPVRIAEAAKKNFERGGPLLVIASGRDTVAVAAEIKRLAPEATFVIQIQHPRCDVRQFDLVITPQHDYHSFTPEAKEEVPRFLLRFLMPTQPPDEHVVQTTGALHHADMITLRSAAAMWHDYFAGLPKPLVYVSIGGPSRRCNYGADLAQELVMMLEETLEVSGGCAWISFSRRTPNKVKEHVRDRLKDHPRISIWDGQGPNPHLGLLSWADTFVITADSVSMLSEACSTGKPVYVIGGERCKWKLAQFHRTLEKRGAIRKFVGNENMRDAWSYPPLNDNAEAAAKVKQILARKGWRIR
ncbi:hypothetical protein CBR_g33922 [Chara braunii]|uniref:Mitochondrial fission protein ELM1 n=1 Tax=Chara braunii TaxID=69332 RepID=A0A388LHE1_CHABU|nr:hypothetical protein CBR_g33922 [Chara braunii]|eukprot:GBG81744.1 hypothetical protein CBR_g33922 [Chara braunii]